MERASRPVTTRDIALLIVHAAGDQVSGRTVMQKLAYFASLRLKAALGHRAYFYGPYSDKVEDAVGNAVIAGELRETVERMPGWRGGPDVRKYTYDLTEFGADRVNDLIEHNSNSWDCVRDSVQAIKKVLPDLDQKTLSSAAKTHLIVSESSEGVAVTAIPDMARSLGWELSEDQVRDTVDLLRRLDLIADVETDRPDQGS